MDWKNDLVVPEMGRLLEMLLGLSASSSLTLGLQNGRQLQGQILRVDTRAGLCLFELQTTPPEEIVYLPISTISYAHIVNPQASLKALTQGKLASRDPENPPPTNLEMRRKLDQLIRPSGLPLTLELPHDFAAEGRPNVLVAVPAMIAAIERIKSDALGKEAINSCTSLVLAHAKGSAPTATVTDKTLNVRLDFESGLPGDLTTTLTTIIERAFA